jgi:hypothetical protein
MRDEVVDQLHGFRRQEIHAIPEPEGLSTLSMGQKKRDGADARVKAQRFAVLPKRAVGHKIAHLGPKRDQPVIEWLRVGVFNIQRELEFFLPWASAALATSSPVAIFP